MMTALAEVLANTGWRVGVHNYLRDLLGPSRTRGYWKRPPAMHDVVVIRPRTRTYGWSGAPQVNRRGNTHIVRDFALATYKGERVGFARWICGSDTSYVVIGPHDDQYELCERCARLDPWTAIVDICDSK